MTAIPFYTLKMVEQLEHAGYLSAQAKACASILAKLMSEEAERATEKFASKSEFIQNLTAIRSEIVVLRQDMKVDISETKAEIVRWVVGVGMLQMALISGLIMRLVQ